MALNLMVVVLVQPLHFTNEESDLKEGYLIWLMRYFNLSHSTRCCDIAPSAKHSKAPNRGLSVVRDKC